MSMLRIVMAVIKLGLVLGLVFGMSNVTLRMMRAAASAQSTGLVSLTRLNRQLGM